MDKRRSGIVVAILALSSFGCGTHFALKDPAPDLRSAKIEFRPYEERGGKKPQPHEDEGVGIEKKVAKDSVQIDEKKIQELTAQKVEFRFPARIAVVKIVKKGTYKPSPLDQEELALFTQTMGDLKHVATVETLPSIFLTDETDLTRLRYAGARIGADMLLIYIHDTTTVSNWNSSATANLLILPLFFVKGKTVETAVGMEGILLHVPSNTVHGVATSKSHGKKDIHNLASEKEAFEEMGKEHYAMALKDLVQTLSFRISSLQK